MIALQEVGKFRQLSCCNRTDCGILVVNCPGSKLCHGKCQLIPTTGIHCVWSRLSLKGLKLRVNCFISRTCSFSCGFAGNLCKDAQPASASRSLTAPADPAYPAILDRFHMLVFGTWVPSMGAAMWLSDPMIEMANQQASSRPATLPGCKGSSNPPVSDTSPSTVPLVSYIL